MLKLNKHSINRSFSQQNLCLGCYILTRTLARTLQRTNSLRGEYLRKKLIQTHLQREVTNLLSVTYTDNIFC